MVVDVTETRNVIPSLEFTTWTTKKSKVNFDVSKLVKRRKVEILGR